MKIGIIILCRYDSNRLPGKILKKLHEERQALYENVADHIVKTENKSSQEVASEIIKVVKI